MTIHQARTVARSGRARGLRAQGLVFSFEADEELSSVHWAISTEVEFLQIQVKDDSGLLQGS